MANLPSLMNLHMRYRLWIAEMNFYINIIRILEDYLTELSAKSNTPEVEAGINGFKQQFVELRKEIDDLRHEMHIIKMTLAAYSREGKIITQETYQSDNHETLEKRFLSLQAGFETMKKDFASFEDK
ncbi:MAG TPA: hypothetical protein VG738_12760 [Chitinophagaceae bacterium]|nr:hypothetical protein [Chitinophagaceae bacterium]